jgi:hypothetical protein
MAVSVNAETLPENGKSKNPETKIIKAGNRLARLVSYVELGVHYQMFKGQKAKYESGKNAGREKPPVLHIAMTFEFPNEEYTGDYPLCISTTRRMDSGEFFDAVVVPQSLADGTLSKAYAMKTKFMKYLTALQQATGKPYPSIADFAAEQAGVMVNVTNKTVGQGDDAKTFANMKPEGITAPQFVHPATGKVEEFEVPAAIGSYCPVFDWDAPTPEAWKALPPWHKTTIKAAVNFGGSPADLMLQADPTLDAVTEGTEDHSDSTPAEPTKAQAPTQEDMPV